MKVKKQITLFGGGTLSKSPIENPSDPSHSQKATISDEKLPTHRWIKKPSATTGSVTGQENNAEGEEEQSSPTNSYRLSSPVKPSAVFEVQRFSYQEAKFYRQKIMEKMMHDNKENNPLRGLLADYNRPQPRVNVTSEAYQEEGALQFLNSNNIAYSKIQVKRGPGRPPRFPRAPEQQQTVKPLNSIDELCAEEAKPPFPLDSGVPGINHANSVLNTNKIAIKREAIRQALMDMV